MILKCAWSVTVSSRQNAKQSKSSEHSWKFLYHRSKMTFANALHFRTNIKYSIRFDETFCGNSVNNLRWTMPGEQFDEEGRAFSLFDTAPWPEVGLGPLRFIAQACRIRALQIHNNFSNRLAILKKHRIFSLGLKEAFRRSSIIISYCRWHANFIVCPLARIFRHLANEHNFWNRSTFLKKIKEHKKFERIFQWKFCKDFRLPGV